jgi:hypothetical protein
MFVRKTVSLTSGFLLGEEVKSREKQKERKAKRHLEE